MTNQDRPADQDKPARGQPSRLPHASVLAQVVGRLVFRSIFRLTVEGIAHVPARGPLIIAGNHTGFLDGPLVFVFAPRTVRSLTKSELYRGPLGWGLELLGQIPVRRGRPDRHALRLALEELGSGGVIGVFPEGTRGTGNLEQVQLGVAWLALRSAALVVPVACFGTAEALPKGRHLPRLRAPVRVGFGEPFRVTIPANPRARSAVVAAAEEIRMHLAMHVERARST